MNFLTYLSLLFKAGPAIKTIADAAGASVGQILGALIMGIQSMEAMYPGAKTGADKLQALKDFMQNAFAAFDKGAEAFTGIEPAIETATAAIVPALTAIGTIKALVKPA